MLLITHLLAGLIIGALSGAWIPAVLGSVIIDLDHFLSYARHGMLNLKEIWASSLKAKDDFHDQRNFLHNIFAWIFISALLIIVDPQFGAIFSLAYFLHLAFDGLDKSDFFPFYPIKKNVKGLTDYRSKEEYVLIAVLTIVFIAIVVF